MSENFGHLPLVPLPHHDLPESEVEAAELDGAEYDEQVEDSIERNKAELHEVSDADFLRYMAYRGCVVTSQELKDHSRGKVVATFARRLRWTPDHVEGLVQELRLFAADPPNLSEWIRELIANVPRVPQIDMDEYSTTYGASATIKFSTYVAIKQFSLKLNQEDGFSSSSTHEYDEVEKLKTLEGNMNEVDFCRRVREDYHRSICQLISLSQLQSDLRMVPAERVAQGTEALQILLNRSIQVYHVVIPSNATYLVGLSSELKPISIWEASSGFLPTNNGADGVDFHIVGLSEYLYHVRKAPVALLQLEPNEVQSLVVVFEPSPLDHESTEVLLPQKLSSAESASSQGPTNGSSEVNPEVPGNADECMDIDTDSAITKMTDTPRDESYMASKPKRQKLRPSSSYSDVDEEETEKLYHLRALLKSMEAAPSNAIAEDDVHGRGDLPPESQTQPGSSDDEIPFWMDESIHQTAAQIESINAGPPVSVVLARPEFAPREVDEASDEDIENQTTESTSSDSDAVPEQRAFNLNLDELTFPAAASFALIDAAEELDAREKAPEIFIAKKLKENLTGINSSNEFNKSMRRMRAEMINRSCICGYLLYPIAVGVTHDAGDIMMLMRRAPYFDLGTLFSRGLTSLPATKFPLHESEESSREMFSPDIPLKAAIVGSYIALFHTKYLIHVAMSLSKQHILHRDLTWKNTYPTEEGVLVGDFNRVKVLKSQSSLPSKLYRPGLLDLQVASISELGNEMLMLIDQLDRLLMQLISPKHPWSSTVASLKILAAVHPDQVISHGIWSCVGVPESDFESMSATYFDKVLPWIRTIYLSIGASDLD